ncbi:beta-lactamase/transpeptidase-like protein [Xylariomycetidae sp. FL0641]|nr:beta-lactamase/transpeptidase-like protein [Xylariomycetidae sp. FL0641]
MTSNGNTTTSASLEQRLAALNPTIEELMRTAGAVGLSLGVQRGTAAPPYVANFGYRDLGSQAPMTSRTILNACSLSKFFVCMAAARAVDRAGNPVTWDGAVRDLLPAFAAAAAAGEEEEDDDLDAVVRARLSLADVLSHRSGLATGPNRRGSGNRMVVARGDCLAYVRDQARAGCTGPFRQAWRYNNAGYELAGLVLDAHLGGSWARALREELLAPLGMARSSVYRPIAGDDDDEDDDDVARVYGTLDDRTPVEIASSATAEDVVGGPGGGLFTCVADLLRGYSGALAAYHDQMATGRTATAGSPIRRAADLLSAKIPMPQPTYREASYALGMCRTQLPGPLGQIGNNAELVGGRMPAVGRGAASTLVFYHQGSRPGTLCAAAMLPEHDASVVVMSNSLGLNDCPDWVLQLVVEELLAVPERNDYLALSRESAAATLKWYPETAEALEQERRAGEESTTTTNLRPLEAYTGTYWNKRRYQKIVVTLEDGTLIWALQGLESEKYPLTRHQGDTFSWLQTRNALISRGRWVEQPASYWKLRFEADEKGDIRMVNWMFDPSVPTNGDFFKE